MSLILEALRKSEAERRRGQAPGLFVEQIPVAAARRTRTPAWMGWLATLVLALLVVLAWREFGRTSPDTTAPTAVTEPKPAENNPPALTEPAPNYPPIAEASAPVASAPSPMPNTFPPETLAPVEAPTALVPTPAETARPAPAAASPIMAPADAIPAPGQTTVASPPAREPAVATEAPLPPTASEDPVPRLASLPASDRAQLPPLKLSMHVYADDPAQRFVILDGRRLQEGASPAAGVVIEQIRRDGLVLSVNGRRVLLARP